MLYLWWWFHPLYLKSIGKADRYLESMLVGIVPTGSDRQRMLPDQILYIWRRFSVMKPDKIMAGLECHRIIHLMNMFLFLAR